MISYKYKLYRTPKTKHLDKMLEEACFVWNHALALQKRYYRIYHKYISIGKMKSHFTKRIKRCSLHTHTRQVIIERLDTSYQRFFKRIAKRPPKFHKSKDFSSILFRGSGGYSINKNVITINRINKRFKFSLSRPYDGKIKTLTVKRNNIGEFYIVLVLDKAPVKIRKSHNGASVGIDFGLKKYMTLSDGTVVNNPQYMKECLSELHKRNHNLSKCKNDSNNKKRRCKELAKLWDDITNKRNDFQWKLAHELCRKYDNIFIEDLNLVDMKLGRRANRKLKDQSHAEFVEKLQYVATKYDVVVHKIDRYFPSSKTCTCGYVNNDLKLSDRKWVCPQCGAVHDRDLLAANNILRRGIYELKSDCKTSKPTAKRQSRYNPRIARQTA